MNIIHTEASCGWGGQEIRILEESRGMLNRGHSVTILCPHESTIYTEAQKYGVTAVALPIGKKRLKGVLSLRNWLKNNHVDILNSHSSTDSWLSALACQALKNPPPIIRTRHISAPIPNNAPSRWLYTKAAKHVVTTGEAIRNQILQTTGALPNHVTSIPTGVDPQRFSPGDRNTTCAELDLDPKYHYIGIVATLRSWKGHHFLLDALKQLNNQDWKLLIVGDGPQHDSITKRISELEIEDHVILVGQQTSPENWFKAMDIFCLPSYANEGVPQSILQAMLSGLPIITTPIGAILDAVTDRETAYIVPPKNSTEITNACNRLIQNSTIRSELGKKARQIAIERFSLENMLDSMESIFSAEK